ncbi:type III polyketide synthase [Nakamurella panacisegetis]|uniref:type III polyketide synthase n=1 Tax=Nakamurella panacisegetis TaxID=1090615 RepID=UPI000B855A95|nr:3-oxoacyl-[acyl-carrier-protein] synthase III C-terminal domain-containing protein [Nakamurella panacisegetis]
MTTLVAVHGVLPEHRYQQDQITQAFAEVCLGDESAANVALLRRLHANCCVDARHLSLPLERYRELADFTEANDEYVRVATDLAEQAVVGALQEAGLRPEDVDIVFSTTVTGLAVPSIEARIAAQVGFRPDVKRVPMFGLGCVAGAAGIARMHDYLLGHPDQVAVLLAVELCSLTVQRDDRSMANLVASGLFGDGAAAVVAVGGAHARAGDGPTVLDTRSHLYPDTQRTMGWDIGAAGLTIVLDAQVPALVEQYLGGDVRSLLAEHDLTVDDIAHWVSHPGGPKVIEAIERELALRPDALEMTWRSLADVGNLSSVSVLHVLRDTLAKRSPMPGTPGVLMAMGPGFCAELVLLRW